MIEKKLSQIPPAEEIELTEEEKAQVAAENRQLAERFKLGQAADPRLEGLSETLMTEGCITTNELLVPVPALTPKGVEVVQQFTEERLRYDFTLAVNRVVAEVEKKVVVDADGERRVISGSTWELGPPHYGVTWTFLTNLTVMVVQYGLPMNRLAKLLSNDDKNLSASTLSKMLRYVAERFAPIYLQLFDELADSAVLMGDDTSPRVLEVNRALKQPASDEKPPWYPYRTKEAAQTLFSENDAPGLAALLSTELGFEFPRRNGEGPKRSLNTSVVSGRQEDSDPRSLIVFYRTHLGGLGNLLETLLEKRSPGARSVTIQSDLATVNLVADQALQAAFDICYVGCASHARRPFALYEEEDPDMCDIILHLFKGLSIHEHGLDLHGRNKQNVLAVRDVDSRAIWEEIKELAQMMTKRWSRETKLGQGARYILRHYDKLTAYLDDPRLEPTNNFSERMLRMEKLIEASSMFRTSLLGRFVLDILRTVIQTSVAAHAPLQEYILFVLQTPPGEIEEAPENFTPCAWVSMYLDPEEEQEKMVPPPLEL